MAALQSTASSANGTKPRPLVPRYWISARNVTSVSADVFPRGVKYLVRVHFEEHKNHHAGDRNVEPNGKRETCNSPVHRESARQRQKERREHHRQRDDGKDYVAG